MAAPIPRSMTMGMACLFAFSGAFLLFCFFCFFFAVSVRPSAQKLSCVSAWRCPEADGQTFENIISLLQEHGELLLD